VFARPGPIVDGARQRRGLLSQFCIILRLTEPFDEVVLGKSQAITPLSERLKVDFALIDQNIANQILWLVSHALYESKFETGCVAGAPKKVPHGLHLNWRNSAQNHQ
jgi:hypothetical protein